MMSICSLYSPSYKKICLLFSHVIGVSKGGFTNNPDKKHSLKTLYVFAELYNSGYFPDIFLI